MQPNTPEAKKREREILIQCECGSYHYLQISTWDLDSGQKLLTLIDRPGSLWRTLSSWWKHRDMWATEIVLDKKDCEDLCKILVPSGQTKV